MMVRTTSKPVANLPVMVMAEPDKGESLAKAHPHETLDRAIRAGLAHVTGGVSPYSGTQAWNDWALHLGRSPGRQLELAERAQANAFKVMSYATGAVTGQDTAAPFAAKAHDHRFAHAAWDNPPFNLWKQGFLAMQDWWYHATDTMRGLDPQDGERTRFQVRQMLDLVSPSNFPWTNPEIIEETTRQGGRNLIEGATHFTEDFMQTLTQTHKPAPEGYQVGTDLACTPGEVVFRNDLFELIQYTPQTSKVRAEPVLFVPAWIMKYDILDLSPQNSMINYLVGEGFTVFMISWCNPTADQAGLSLEDYRINGVLAALEAINAIVPDRK
ncbi:MAG: poly-beta-hydroxybutyrate polymerase N-terminal domain-containing protein, partial [Roseovarius sp.]|nr:poly-beta-hydroxybutyrate polymerase N-terminal domain-containing protein [Roseovarius sp.]